MIRARGGVTSYVGYGALTLIIMYILFLYNATKNGLNTCESNNTNLKDEKRELLSQLSVSAEHTKRLKRSADYTQGSLQKCTAARKEKEREHQECLEKLNDSNTKYKNKETELSKYQRELEEANSKLVIKEEDCAKKEQSSLLEYNKYKEEREKVEVELQGQISDKTSKLQQLTQELANLQQQHKLLEQQLKQQQQQVVNSQQGNGNQQPYVPAGNPAVGNPAAGNPVVGNPAAGIPTAGNPAPSNPAVGNPAAGNPAAGNSVRNLVENVVDTVQFQGGNFLDSNITNKNIPAGNSLGGNMQSARTFNGDVPSANKLGGDGLPGAEFGIGQANKNLIENKLAVSAGPPHALVDTKPLAADSGNMKTRNEGGVAAFHETTRKTLLDSIIKRSLNVEEPRGALGAVKDGNVKGVLGEDITQHKEHNDGENALRVDHQVPERYHVGKDVADGMNNAQYKQDGRVPPQQPLPLHPLEGNEINGVGDFHDKPQNHVKNGTGKAMSVGALTFKTASNHAAGTSSKSGLKGLGGVLRPPTSNRSAKNHNADENNAEEAVDETTTKPAGKYDISPNAQDIAVQDKNNVDDEDTAAEERHQLNEPAEGDATKLPDLP